MLNSSNDTELTYELDLYTPWDCKTQTEQCKPKHTKEDGNNLVVTVDSLHTKEK
jgi:hypothetical protein